MSRCTHPCDHCHAVSLGPILAARQCRRCSEWTPADRPPEVKAPVTLPLPTGWRGQAEHFVQTLRADERQLDVDLRRARERRLPEMETWLVELRDRIARLRGDTVEMLVATAPGIPTVERRRLLAP